MTRRETALSELTKRILFAVPAAVVFITALWYGGWAFDAVVILIGLFIQFEVIRLMRKAGLPTDPVFPYTIGLWVMLLPYLPFAAEIGMGIFLLFIAIQTFNTRERAFEELSTTFFAGIYAPLGLLTLMLLRNMGSNEQGFAIALTVIVMIWGGDIFAYLGGRTFGKRPLAAAISPKKTIEGFLIGFIGCGVGLSASLYLIPFESPLTILTGFPLIFLIGIFGPVGDLVESKIKRKAGVKDSSGILPGHGGFFDRFDAFILAAPAMYIYIQILKWLGYVSL